MGWIAVLLLGTGPATPQTILVRAADQAIGLPPGARTVRELADPFTGEHWVLVREVGHSGGPGRWISLGGGYANNSAAAVKRSPLVIRAGDRMVVERHTPIVDEVLEAVALSNAAAGERLTVRLTLGGHLAAAVALDKGRAELDVEGAGS